MLAKHHIRRWNAEQIAENSRVSAVALGAWGCRSDYGARSTNDSPIARAFNAVQQVADRIQQLLDEMALCDVQQPESQTLRDVPLLPSLPGVGFVITAIMLAEAAALFAERDYYAILAHAGIAPVTTQIGNLSLALGGCDVRGKVKFNRQIL
jgi:hypothetical protein